LVQSRRRQAFCAWRFFVGQSGGHGFAGHFASDALPQRAAAAFLPASFITGWYACLP